MELAFLPATEQAALVSTGKVAPVELVEAYLERIWPPAGEELLLRVCAQLEATQPWASRRPPVS